MKRITLKDIAGRLDVSPATVSRALAGNSLISEATRQRVAETAAELGYQPNLTARALRRKSGSALVLILPEINGFFVPEMIFGINAAARKFGFPVMMFLTDNQFSREKELLEYAVQLGAAGVLLSISEETSDYEHITRFSRDLAPVVLIDKTADAPELPGVTINGAQAARDAVDYLWRCGHRNIAGFFGNPQLTISRRRKSGFCEALGEAGMSRPERCCFEVSQILELPGVFSRFRENMPECTAIFTMSDELLVHTYHELLRKGLRIPEDISIITVSDGFAPYYLFPNITHIHHSGFEAGYHATQKLIGMVTGENRETAGLTLPAKLCELDSVRTLSP